MAYVTVRHNNFQRGDEVMTFEHEDMTHELAVINCNLQIECFPMSMLGKEDDVVSESLAVWHDKNFLRVSTMIQLLMLALIVGITICFIFLMLKTLKKLAKT